VLIACEVSGDVHAYGDEGALEHPDFPPSLRDELAKTISTRHVDVQVRAPNASVKLD